MSTMPPREKCIHEFISGPQRGKFRQTDELEYHHAKVLHDHRVKLEETIRKAEEELKYLVSNCKHPVCYDTPGIPYDVRHCTICGHQSLL
ncbi:MAG TPA: hypothetical protein VFM18_10850 [Methanosarcina sp.]|nr:hypothetical protein [Methanosarcina sp.]